MLSAFTARLIIELKQRDRSKIETILAHGDRVLVGLNSGDLRIYRVNEVADPANDGTDSSKNDPPPSPLAAKNDGGRRTKPIGAKPTDLLRDIEKFSPRAIEQLAIIKEANTIVSLSNYQVSLHDLQSYQLIETLVRTRNATCFAVTSNIVKDPSTGIPEIISRLAVAVKRRLLVWSWHESELADDVTEIVLVEAIRTVTWASATRVVCGMNAAYALVDVLTGDISELAPPGTLGSSVAGGQGSRFGVMSSASMGYMGLGSYMPKPLAAKLADGEILLAKDINTMFVTDEGRSENKRQIPWQSAPEFIGYSYPYILALQGPARGTLEVRSPETLSLLQTISLPGAAQLHFPPPTVSLAHAGKGFHVSGDRTVWKMDATDYDSQVSELVAQRRFDEAVSLLEMLEDALLRDKTESLREVKMLKAEMLFAEKKKYRESMDLFNEDDVRAPPERVLRLFPPMVAGELSAWKPPEEDGVEGRHGGENGNRPDDGREGGRAEEVSPKKSNGSADTAAAVHPTLEEAAVPAVSSSSPLRAGGGFAKLLMGRKAQPAQPAQPDTASTVSFRKSDNGPDDGPNGKPKAADDDPGPLEGKDLMDAVLELNSYLAGTRARLQRVIDPVNGKLKPAAREDPAELSMSGLILPKHQEDADSGKQLEDQLRKTFRLVDTALFRAYMFSRPTLVGSLLRIANFCDPDVVHEKLLEHSRYNELVDFLHGKKLHTQALELLRRFGEPRAAPPDAGDGRNKGKRDGDDDDDEDDDDTPEALRGPRRTVMYLQNLPPSELDLIFKHSEWTLRADPDLGMEVFLADTENAETLPRHRVVAFLGRIDSELEVRYLEHVVGDLKDLTPDFHNRLAELYIRRLREEGARDAAWEAVMQRFVKFLRNSRQYSLSKAFALIPRDEPAFYEAQAVVLSNMGQHKQALEIYVFRMKDFAKAEDYCNRVHISEDSNPASPIKSRPGAAADPEESVPSIYHTLLSLYLTPAPPHKPALDPALDLLSKHGSRLPAASTLSLIPDTLPVASLESYFRGRIRAATSTMHETHIMAGLRATQLIAAQAALHLGEGSAAGDGQAGRNRRVVVSEERVCGVCHKRLGRSVVSVMPNNAVVHYGCAGKATNMAAAAAGGRMDGVRMSNRGR